MPLIRVWASDFRDLREGKGQTGGKDGEDGRLGKGNGEKGFCWNRCRKMDCIGW